MADFQPRFVDLVRNYTSTQGTGAFVLGPSVNGFTGFGSALQTGDSFYYSAIGIDKPAEREIGRGTLQANGTISRTPLAGSLTNFSNGTKSIALIAPSEWFNTVQASVAAAPAGAATRAALAASALHQGPALLTERGREGLFAFDSANLSSAVASDPRQGVYIAPASDPSGSSGAWVRKFSGPVNVRWFGAVGDDATNDGAAFQGALAYLNAVGQSADAYGYPGRSTQSLFIPAGRYFLGTNTLDVVSTLIIEGEGNGSEAAQASVLRWSAGVTGIRIQATTTSGDSATGLSLAYSGDGSIIRNLQLYGSGTVNGAGHAIHMRARATVQDVFIDHWQGNGVNIVADAGSGNGNANLWRLERLVIQNCQNGVLASGGDTNAGVGYMVSVLANRAWGVDDSSFLGNSWEACHSAGNGSGAYRTTSSSNSSVFNGCYDESGQPACAFAGHTLVIGGTHGAGLGGWGGYLSVQGTSLVAADDLLVNDNIDARGANHTIGPQSGASDATTFFYTANVNHYLWGKYKDGTWIGWLNFHYNFGLDLNAQQSGSRIALQNQGNDVVSVDSAGANLAAGKVLKVSGTQVVASRRAGWAAATGTATRTTFATASVTLPQLAEHVKALIDDLVAHGLIGA